MRKRIKTPNLIQFPPPSNIDPADITRRARAQLNLREFLRRAIKGKPMCPTSAQKENLINRLTCENYYKDAKSVCIFHCPLCDLWQLSNRQRFLCRYNEKRFLEVFRVCRVCAFVCRKTDIQLRYEADHASPKRKNLSKRSKRTEQK